jgi:hypothetical protein
MVLRTIIAFSFVMALERIDAAAATDAEEIAATAAWFDSLDLLPDLRDKPYIEISYGKTWVRDAMVERSRERGFLLAENGKTYALFCDGVDEYRGFTRDGWRIGVKEFRKEGPDPTEINQRSVRRLDLAAVVDETIAEAQNPEPRAETWKKPFGRNASDRTAVFILARCCSRQGRADLAKKLDAALLDLAAKPTNNSTATNAPFRNFVEKDIAHSLMWRAVVEIGKPTVSRLELLAQFERIARDFPASEHHGKAAEYAATLRTMIAEDEAHSAAAKPWAHMSREEQMHEWIFRLRDQHGEQMGEPGGVELLELMVPPGGEPSPGWHLLQLGYAAVPALIEALDDHRLTRSVQCGRSFYFSHEPLTVSDCAQAILSRISGRNFRAFRQESHRAEIMDWWRQTEEKGEKEMLVKNVRAAIDWCDPQIQRLIELDPAAAVEALKEGIGKSQVNWVQAEMIASLGTIKSEAATHVLRDEMKRCSSMQGRVAAAQALWHRGEKDLVPAMIAEWNQCDGATRSQYEYPDSLIAFLSHCGDVAAMKALAARFSALPADEKVKVLGWVTGTQRRYRSPQVEQTPIPAEAAAVAERLATSALEDPPTNIAGRTLEGVTFMSPRVCDLAAYALAKAWPQRYAFTWAESPFSRDAQIIKLRNLWRHAHGLPPLPLPVRPSHPAAATDPNIVAGCRWMNGPEIPGLPISVGKPLTADGLFDAIVQLEGARPPGCSAFHLTVDRPAERDGVTVEITWIHGRQLRGRESDSTRLNTYDCLFSVGNKQAHRTNSAFHPNQPPDSKLFGEERWATAKVLESPAEEPVTIRFYCW